MCILVSARMLTAVVLFCLGHLGTAGLVCITCCVVGVLCVEGNWCGVQECAA